MNMKKYGTKTDGLSKTNRMKLKPISKKKKKKKKIQKKSKTPLLSVNTIFGKQNSTIHSIHASLCIDALKEGCVDSFQEIFKLSHRDDILIDPISEKYFNIGSDKLMHLQKLLCQAEKLLMKGMFRDVYQIYKEIADYLEGEKDFETSIYYHQKGKKICIQSQNKPLECLARENFGKLYVRLNQLPNAMKEHEEQLSIAENPDYKEVFSNEDIERARKNLIHVYLSMWDELKEKKEFQKCSVYLHKSYELAKEDPKVLSNIVYQLGIVYEKMNDLGKAIQFLGEYRDLCDQIGDVKGSSIADKKIGTLIAKSGKFDEALQMYESFLTKARESKNDRNIGKSCEKIGMLLVQKQEFLKSIPYFEENYNLAKQSGDLKWMNKARIDLGFAKGNNRMNGFLGLIKNNNIQKLLQWKDKRDDVFYGNEQNTAHNKQTKEEDEEECEEEEGEEEESEEEEGEGEEEEESEEGEGEDEQDDNDNDNEEQEDGKEKEEENV